MPLADATQPDRVDFRVLEWVIGSARLAKRLGIEQREAHAMIKSGAAAAEPLPRGETPEDNYKILSAALTTAYEENPIGLVEACCGRRISRIIDLNPGIDRRELVNMLAATLPNRHAPKVFAGRRVRTQRSTPAKSSNFLTYWDPARGGLVNSMRHWLMRGETIGIITAQLLGYPQGTEAGRPNVSMDALMDKGLDLAPGEIEEGPVRIVRSRPDRTENEDPGRSVRLNSYVAALTRGAENTEAHSNSFNPYAPLRSDLVTIVQTMARHDVGCNEVLFAKTAEDRLAALKETAVALTDACLGMPGHADERRAVREWDPEKHLFQSWCPAVTEHLRLNQDKRVLEFPATRAMSEPGIAIPVELNRDFHRPSPLDNEVTSEEKSLRAEMFMWRAGGGEEELPLDTSRADYQFLQRRLNWKTPPKDGEGFSEHLRAMVSAHLHNVFWAPQYGEVREQLDRAVEKWDPATGYMSAPILDAASEMDLHGTLVPVDALLVDPASLAKGDSGNRVQHVLDALGVNRSQPARELMPVVSVALQMCHGDPAKAVELVRRSSAYSSSVATWHVEEPKKQKTIQEELGEVRPMPGLPPNQEKFVVPLAGPPENPRPWWDDENSTWLKWAMPRQEGIARIMAMDRPMIKGITRPRIHRPKPTDPTMELALGL